MINWNDRSDSLCAMHSIHLGALTLDVYRAHVGALAQVTATADAIEIAAPPASGSALDSLVV